MLLVKTKRKFGKFIGHSFDGKSIRQMTLDKIKKMRRHEYLLLKPLGTDFGTTEETIKEYNEAVEELFKEFKITIKK
jgi:hypothetical protein